MDVFFSLGYLSAGRLAWTARLKLPGHSLANRLDLVPRLSGSVGLYFSEAPVT